jgi:hypothetical protein
MCCVTIGTVIVLALTLGAATNDSPQTGSTQIASAPMPAVGVVASTPLAVENGNIASAPAPAPQPARVNNRTITKTATPKTVAPAAVDSGSVEHGPLPPPPECGDTGN